MPRATQALPPSRARSPIGSRRGGCPVEDRLLDQHAQWTKRREQMRRERVVQARLAEERPNSPSINQESHTLHRGVADMQSWEMERHIKRQLRAQEAERAATAELQEAPRIDPLSEMITRRMPRHMPVEDLLLARHVQSQGRLESERDRRSREAMESSTPKISSRHSPHMRVGNVVDRLYSPRRAASPSESSQSSRTRTLKRSHSADVVADRLWERGVELQKKRAIWAQEGEGKRSDRRTGSPLGGSKKRPVSQRLQQPTGNFRQSFVKEVEKESSYPFKPQVNALSSRIDSLSSTAAPTSSHHETTHDVQRERREILMQKQNTYLENRERLREKYEEEDFKECVFRPTIHSRRKNDTAASQTPLPNGAPLAARPTRRRSPHLVRSSSAGAQRTTPATSSSITAGNAPRAHSPRDQHRQENRRNGPPAHAPLKAHPQPAEEMAATGRAGGARRSATARQPTSPNNESPPPKGTSQKVEQSAIADQGARPAKGKARAKPFDMDDEDDSDYQEEYYDEESVCSRLQTYLDRTAPAFSPSDPPPTLLSPPPPPPPHPTPDSPSEEESDPLQVALQNLLSDGYRRE